MFHPALGLLVTLIQARVARAQRLERGASAVEWVVIAAILVGICVLVAGILTGAIGSKANEIGGEIQGA